MLSPKKGFRNVTQLAKANASVVVEQLRGWNAQAVSQVVEYRGETTIVVPKEPRFELNYHLLSIPRRARVRLRTSVSIQHPVIDSLVPLWPAANWLEREIFDLFGIRFEGHPDLRRILLPDDFEGAPLRRDFPVEGKR